jgi:hypothetical protein
MTEAEWLACTETAPMLGFLRTKASVRKFRLFAVACCRRISPLILKTKLGYRAVMAAERMADHLNVSEDLGQLYESLSYEAFCWIDGCHEKKLNQMLFYAAYAACDGLEDEDSFRANTPTDRNLSGLGLMNVSSNVAWAAAHWERRNDLDAAKAEVFRRESLEHVNLAHDIFGNPFRPAVIDPACLTWDFKTVPKIAQAIYDDRAFDRLRILADALEEADCTDADILDHCRQPGEHVRGCWVVDLLLDKECLTGHRNRTS